MEKWNFDYVTKNNLLVYKYLRGSWCHGIGVEGKSDYDYGGVFLAPKDMILGLRSSYVEQVADAKNDDVDDASDVSVDRLYRSLRAVPVLVCGRRGAHHRGHHSHQALPQDL